MDKINLNKTVFEKRQYPKVINTSFSQLGLKSPPPESLPAESSVDEFFNKYSELFYDIPETGDINSHEFLIKQSSAYIGFEATNEDIQALLDEISSLREENLDLQKQILNI
jgi:hypothetical protein